MPRLKMGTCFPSIESLRRDMRPSAEAVVAAEKLKSNFPAIDVAVFDVINKSYTAIDLEKSG